MLAEIPNAEFAAALDRCAEDLLWESAVDQPPVNAALVAQQLGMPIAADRAQAGRARRACLGPLQGRPGVAAVFVAAEQRAERRQFAIAHELGEAFAYRVYELLGVDPCEAAPAIRERIANQLAGRLLAPKRWLRGLWRDLDGEIVAIKQVFSTASHELIARRALESLCSPLVVTVTDHDQVAWRRWNGPGSPPPRAQLEVECQRRAFHAGEPAWGDDRRDDGVGRVRAWPIHESGWRREITIAEPAWVDPDWRYAA